MNISLKLLMVFILLMLGSCFLTSEEHKNAVKQQQYIVEGRDLYLAHCSNCHSENGEGLQRLYPPLKNSDYFQTNLGTIACLIRHGQKGVIRVNGIEYNGEMPPHQDLKQLEIAEIITFIANQFNQIDTLIEVSSVQKILANCE